MSCHRVTWYGLKSGLQLVSTCTGLGGSWDKLSYELRPAAISVGLGAWQEVWGKPRPYAACFVFVNF